MPHALFFPSFPYQTSPSTLMRSDLSLTYAVAENDGQNHSYSHSDQGGALPGAVLRWFLEFESPSGQAVSGQRARWCGVNRPRCHGVTWGSCAKERCRSGARFKKKMPGERERKNRERRKYRSWEMVQNSIEAQIKSKLNSNSQNAKEKKSLKYNKPYNGSNSHVYPTARGTGLTSNI